jgi:hypothetical protein
MTHHWLSYAEAQHKNLQLDVDMLIKAYELVHGALGSEWLQHEERVEGMNIMIWPGTPVYGRVREGGRVGCTEIQFE